MLEYTRSANKIYEVDGLKIHSFVSLEETNIDWDTVKSFGEEWTKFSEFTDEEITSAGDEYFDIITREMISESSIVLDVGCGSGRWSKYLSDKVRFIEAIDPSDAIFSATKLLKTTNSRVTHASVDNIPFADNSFDFIFSLGVLHHIPDTKNAMEKCVKKLKTKGYFMVYLYYDLEGRGFLYKSLFHSMDLVRKVISRMNTKGKKAISDFIAVLFYLPLSRISKLLVSIGLKKIAKILPLYNYHDKSFRLMRNDALDRFGTPLEQRFSKEEITKMMLESGLTNITFSNSEPFWHAVGQKT